MKLSTKQRGIALWGRLAPADRWGDVEIHRQAGRVAAFTAAMLLWVVIFTPIYWLLGAPACSIVLITVGAVLVGCLVAIFRGAPPFVCGNIICSAGWCTYTALVYLTGGQAAPSPTLTWFASVPICAVYMAGLRSGVFWTIASIVSITGYALADHAGWRCPNPLSTGGMRLLQYTALVGLVLCVYILVHVLTRLEQIARRTLREANSRLEVQSSLDALTGIANRRCFDWTIEREWKRHERTGTPISLALIDVDWFKQYNDTLGHLAGDEVLRAIALGIQSGIHRPGDLVARFGGEEFAVILPNTDEAQSRYVMATVHQRVRSLEINYPDVALGPFVTISIGVATVVPALNDSHLELIKQADLALYRAKAEGRDRTIHAARMMAASH